MKNKKVFIIIGILSGYVVSSMAFYKLNPRYYELGVQKFAYITKAEFLPFAKDIHTQNGKFKTRNFISYQDALNWLNK